VNGRVISPVINLLSAIEPFKQAGAAAYAIKARIILPACLILAHKSGSMPLAHVFSDKIPVNQIPESIDIILAGIAVVYVIGMFPYIAGK
jgi:hypothetical protein